MKEGREFQQMVYKNIGKFTLNRGCKNWTPLT